MAGAKISHFKDTSAQIWLIVGTVIKLTLRPEGRATESFCCLPASRVLLSPEMQLTWCSHFTLFSLGPGPASSCHDHWHPHSCSALLAHSAQTAKRARALFPRAPCLLWTTGASPVHSAEDPWPGHRAPSRKRNWDPEHCVVTNSALREGGMSSWGRILMAAATGDPTQGPRQEAGSCELWARAGMMSVTRGWGGRPGSNTGHDNAVTRLTGLRPGLRAGPRLVASAPSLGAQSSVSPPPTQITTSWGWIN